MKRLASDVFIFFVLFFLSIPAFSSTLICSADNDKTYRINIPAKSYGEFTEEIRWIKGKKAGTVQKIFIKNINKLNFSDDYIRFSDGTYKITYALRCLHE